VVEAMAAQVERPSSCSFEPHHLAVRPGRRLLPGPAGAPWWPRQPFDPVQVGGTSRRICQCNNCFLFPGLGFAGGVGARDVW